MNIVLWILQVILAVFFTMVGGMKVSVPLDQLLSSAPWVESVPTWAPRVAGASELLGAIGLLLPSILRKKPILTPLAGMGLMVVMILATCLHISRGEMQNVVVTLILAGLLGFVVYGRWKLVPISGSRKKSKKK